MSISIHALLAESDNIPNFTSEVKTDFYPRSPCGERPPVRDVIQWEGIFLSTLSLRRATNGHETTPYRVVISIHALLAESDILTEINKMATGQISIHALLAESDQPPMTVPPRPKTFLSTLSLRRATQL